MKFYTGVGSRTIPDNIYSLFVDIAKILEHENFTVRSGGAEGSDTAFDTVLKRHIYLPYNGFNGHYADNINYIINIDDSDMMEARAPNITSVIK